MKLVEKFSHNAKPKLIKACDMSNNDWAYIQGDRHYGGRLIVCLFGQTVKEWYTLNPDNQLEHFSIGPAAQDIDVVLISSPITLEIQP